MFPLFFIGFFCHFSNKLKQAILIQRIICSWLCQPLRHASNRCQIHADNCWLATVTKQKVAKIACHFWQIKIPMKHSVKSEEREFHQILIKAIPHTSSCGYRNYCGFLCTERTVRIWLQGPRHGTGKEIEFRAEILIGEQIGTPIKGQQEKAQAQFLPIDEIPLGRYCVDLNAWLDGGLLLVLCARVLSMFNFVLTLGWLIILNCYRIIETRASNRRGSRPTDRTQTSHFLVINLF